MATLQQLDSFHRFAKERIDRGAGESMSDLFVQWELENRTPEQKAEDIAAIQASLDDLRRGVPTRDVNEILNEIRFELGLSADQ
jgi:hypothetical protein